MSKRTFITIILSGSVFTLIVTDFYHGIPWYIQFGPILLAFTIIFIGDIFEKKEDKIDTVEERESSGKHWLLAMATVWLAIIAMNIFVGEPDMKAFNIRQLEFWMFLVGLPLLSQLSFKKRTDET